MSFIPFEKYTFSTSLSPQQIRQRLLDNIEPRRDWSLSWRNPTKPYSGTLTADGFTISRVIRYRNSFLPVITGQFMPDNGITAIHIRMRMNPLVMIFMIFWLGVIGTLAIALPVSELIAISQGTSKGLSPAYLIPFGMFAFGYILMTASFKAESSKAKKFLAELFEPSSPTPLG